MYPDNPTAWSEGDLHQLVLPDDVLEALLVPGLPLPPVVRVHGPADALARRALRHCPTHFQEFGVDELLDGPQRGHVGAIHCPRAAAPTEHGTYLVIVAPHGHGVAPTEVVQQLQRGHLVLGAGLGQLVPGLLRGQRRPRRLLLLIIILLAFLLTFLCRGGLLHTLLHLAVAVLLSAPSAAVPVVASPYAVRAVHTHTDARILPLAVVEASGGVGGVVVALVLAPSTLAAVLVLMFVLVLVPVL
mmetsp:Transcript_513/g.1203  ORF Transcript_513/g.1203 Transcript_513/m.1203 type:complete len:244 (-) Transcript_513:1207-1938(-)